MNNYSWINNVPPGWEKLAHDVIEECEKIFPQFEIIQLKEKYGSMVCYCSSAPEEVYDIIDNFEEISKTTCCQCGKKATKHSTGWILPWCDNCGKDEDKYYIVFNES